MLKAISACVLLGVVVSVALIPDLLRYMKIHDM